MGSLMPAPDVRRLANELKSLQKLPPQDEVDRKQLYDAIRSLSYVLEPAGLSFQRITFAPFQLHVANLAADIKLFDILAKNNDTPATTEELALATETDENFLDRILRYMSAFGMISEVGEGLWSANKITKVISKPGLQAGISCVHDAAVPAMQAMSSHFAEMNYKNPESHARNAFQAGLNTDLSYYQWIQSQPDQLHKFNLFMSSFHEGQKIFLDAFPFDKLVGPHTTADTPLFVDVGGGIGHQSRAVRGKYPELPGRVILQDMPHVVAQAPHVEGVETMAYDLNKEQPVKGARAYYMRNVMHNNTDDRCVTILQTIMKAMNEESVILIDDLIIPPQGVHWYAAQYDLTMMLFHNALQRTRKQWEDLLEMAGLEIRELCTYTEDLQDSIIVAVPKSKE